MSAENIPLILFAKAPEAGKVKTRLMPMLTAPQAAQIAEILLEKTVGLAKQTWRGRIVLAVWPTVNHPFIQYLAEKYEIECELQGEGNLGDKMHQAMQGKGYPCAVMGCDVPHCDPEILEQAMQALQASKNVIGLTDDGGYYLLGLTRSCPEIFQSIEWGSDSVAEKTLETARQHAVVFHRLKQINDIDDYQDLVCASSQLPALARWLGEAK